jgi:putative oxidoreductase
MFSYLRNRPLDAAAALVGRCLIAYVFIGAAIWHLSSTGWGITIADMRAHGVPAPALCLVGAMTISTVASLALLAGFHARPAAYVLAGYTILVASVMHNPMHAGQAMFILYVKDLGIAGALLALGSLSQTIRPARNHN